MVIYPYAYHAILLPFFPGAGPRFTKLSLILPENPTRLWPL
jgi:hypothetical protein